MESVLSGMGEPIKSEIPDDLKLNLISQLHMGQKTVHLNMPEQTAMHSVVSMTHAHPPASRIHMGIARWGRYSSVISSQSIHQHLQVLQKKGSCNHVPTYTLQLHKVDTHLVLQ